MLQGEVMAFLDTMSKMGCGYCGNRFTDVCVEDDGRKGVIKYKICCPNCGVVRSHTLLTGFEKTEDAFSFLNKMLKKGIKK